MLRPASTFAASGVPVSKRSRGTMAMRVDAVQLDKMIQEPFRSPSETAGEAAPPPAEIRLCPVGFWRERATGVEPATSSLGS